VLDRFHPQHRYIRILGAVPVGIEQLRGLDPGDESVDIVHAARNRVFSADHDTASLLGGCPRRGVVVV
jgi:hypothetical protein